MKRISTLVLTTVLMLCGTTAFAQTEYHILEDRTLTLQNPDFKTGTPVDRLVRTYAKDMSDDGLGAGGSEMYGQQPVTGWTALAPTDNIKADPSAVGADARASALYPYVAYDPTSEEETRPGLGGNYYPPYASSEVTGNCLGMTSVWGQTVQYTQSVELEAGAYMLTYKYLNVGSGTTPSANLFGFICSDEEKYMSKATSFPVGVEYDAATMEYNYTWSTDTIIFQLDAATSGQLSLGFAFGGGSGGTLHMFIDRVNLYKIDPNDLVRDQINALKVELLDLIEIGKAYGVDTSASQTVYNNPNATLAEVQAAIENQKKINEEGTTDFSPFFIQNPHFTEDDPVDSQIYTYARDMDGQNGGSGVGGWGIAEGGSMRFGSQHITGWNTFNESDNKWRSKSAGDGPLDGRASGIFEVGSAHWLGGTAYLPPTTMSDGSTEGKVLGMVGCWGNKVQYTQYVTIPAGKYILSISYYNSGGTVSIPKNLIGFIADDGTEYLCQNKTFPVGRWSTEEIEFELAEETSGNFSMGYETTGGSAGMPHFFIDGISLIYIGTGIDPSFFALKAAVSSAESILGTYMFNTDLMEELQGYVNDGNELLDASSTDSEANTRVATAINTLIPVVRENIQAYIDLDKFANDTEGDLYKADSKYGLDPNFSDFYNNAFTDYLESVTTVLSDYDKTTEQIHELMAQLPVVIRRGVQATWDAVIAKGEVLEEPLDISALFETLGVTYSTATAQGANVPDKQWNYGDATNFKTQYGTMEVWSQTPFTVSQTLADMPVGTYTIASRGFYRTAANADNIANYNPDAEEFFIFAGHSRKAFINDAAFAESTSHDGWAEATTGVFVPNGQLAAYNIFTDGSYDEYTYRTVSTMHREAGDLTFGVKALEMPSDNWCVWHTFEVYYNISTNSDINSDLEGLIAEAKEMIMTDVANVDEAVNDLDDAIAEGEDAANPGTTMPVIEDAIKQLEAALAKGNSALKALADLKDKLDEMEKFIYSYNYISSDNRIFTIWETASAGGVYETIADVEAVTNSMLPAWYAHVLGQKLTSATPDAPVDVTGVILNPDFELLSTKYWTISEGIGDNVGYQSNATYADETGGTVIEHFMEAWRKDAVLNDGLMVQEIGTTLPKGWYTLELDGFATNQSAEPTTDLSGVCIHAAVGDDVVGHRIPIVPSTNLVAKHVTLDFYADGVSPVTVGVSIFNASVNWYVADNFKLSFVGSTPPVGIADIENAEQAAPAKAIYSLTGTRTSRLQKGLNIVVDSNGHARKVFVK